MLSAGFDSEGYPKGPVEFPCKEKTAREDGRCAAATNNQHQCLGLRVVGILCLRSNRRCGGVSQGRCCCLLCGGGTLARSAHVTAGARL
ncbi:hypothetical protein PFLUV_G00108700 [Perca fluviatilis]|uniref:Uncharacterized protein n=1 Tax=Perca fluviatilis TaxID=8168 RepID=A0A6A5F228_PERFL|nr:hypothetical protein PFLUV_G00108700 [Perca fluviatilis]